MALLNPSLFRNRQPGENLLPQDCLVVPDILPDVLDPCSMLISAPAGYGKTTLAFLAQSAAGKWMHLPLRNDDLASAEIVDSLLAAITKRMWHYLGEKPAAFQLLGRRAEAAKYFMQQYVGLDIDFWLEMLAEDYPEHVDYLHQLAQLQPRQLFTETADNELRLSILLDCIRRLEFDGVGIWLDLQGELAELPYTAQGFLAYLYDFLNLLRNRSLYIKCLATPSVIRFLQPQRGVRTLSATSLALTWSEQQLTEIIERRLSIASQGQIHRLDDLIRPDQFEAFLRDHSDPHNPSAWINLAYLLTHEVNKSGMMPAVGAAWLAARRAYCAAHLKIYRDQEGRFWRGNQLLEGLVPRKRAIYPLIDYLYEHPGIHSVHQLTSRLNIDENNLNTTVSRARKDHIEPQFAEADDDGSEFIYLVTDHKGGGYQLQHTDRLP